MRSPNAVDMCELCDHSAARYCGGCLAKQLRYARRDTLQEVKQEMSRLIEKRGAIKSWTGLCQWLHTKLDESETP